MATLLLVVLALLMGATRTSSEPHTTEAAKCVPEGAETVRVLGCRTSVQPLFQCDVFPAIGAPSPGVAVMEFNTKDCGDASTHLSCARLISFTRGGRGGSRESLTFNCRETLPFNNFTVGWAVYKRSCSSFPIVVEVSILKGVADLNPFWYDSSDDRFWDFSSPVFSAPRGVLVSVRFNMPELHEKTKACEISLDNIYHLGNTSIQIFYLFSNWNKSTNLRLGNMPKLKIFKLAGTSLQHFPQDAHVMMRAVEELTLQDNVLLRPLPAGLSLMERLHTLDLSGSRVGNFSGWLPPLPQLRRLVVRGAGLCCLREQRDPGAAFRSARALSHLDISGNALPALGAALWEMRSLRYLDASRNLLHEFPQMHVRGSATLNFAHNRLRTLPGCSRLGPGNRTLRLDLTRNQVSSWKGATDMLRCVETVNLSYNAIATFSDGMLASLDSVEVVDLRGNPVDCGGCPLVRLRTWLLETRARVLPLVPGHDAGALTCARPPLLAGQPVGSAPTRASSCDQPPAAGSPLLAAVLAGLSAGAALLLAAAGCYRYRFEIAYTAHLLTLRRRARRGRRHAPATGADHFLFDAFILYSGSDRPWVVGSLVPLLENGPQRYRICLHERDFQLGTVIVQNISSSMDRSRHTIIVLSKSFLSSRWCLWEMDLANHRTLDPSQREFIILLELEPLERSALPRHLRFLMDTRTYLEWHQAGDAQYEEQAFRKLKRALGPSCFSCSDSGRC